MDETAAGTLLSLALARDRDLGAMCDTIATISDEALRRRFDRAVADLTGLIARDFVLPIERLHPAPRPAP